MKYYLIDLINYQASSSRLCIKPSSIRRGQTLGRRRIINWNSLAINKNPRNQLLATSLGRDVATKLVELVTIKVDTCSEEVGLGVATQGVEVVGCVHDWLVIDA